MNDNGQELAEKLIAKANEVIAANEKARETLDHCAGRIRKAARKAIANKDYNGILALSEPASEVARVNGVCDGSIAIVVEMLEIVREWETLHPNPKLEESAPLQRGNAWWVKMLGKLQIQPGAGSSPG